MQSSTDSLHRAERELRSDVSCHRPLVRAYAMGHRMGMGLCHGAWDGYGPMPWEAVAREAVAREAVAREAVARGEPQSCHQPKAFKVYWLPAHIHAAAALVSRLVDRAKVLQHSTG